MLISLKFSKIWYLFKYLKTLNYSIKVSKIANSKKKSVPINEQIKANEVMLIDSDGKKKGLVSLKEAIDSAKVASLDLVQVSSSDIDPVVCKILDYGKHVFAKKKSTSSSKSKVKKRASIYIKK